MPSTIKSVASLAAVTLLVQPSPARFVSVIPKIIGGMSSLGNLLQHIGNPRGSIIPPPPDNYTVDDEILLGIPRVPFDETQLPVPNQLAWQICRVLTGTASDQLQTATVNFSGPAPGNVLVDGIPPACMTLLTVFTDEHAAGSPIPEGTDSALFTNLSDEEIKEIQDALDAHA